MNFIEIQKHFVFSVHLFMKKYLENRDEPMVAVVVVVPVQPGSVVKDDRLTRL